MPPFLLSVAERYIRPAFTVTINFISWAPRLAVARLVAKWRSLLTIIVGVILGAGVGALIPLYTTAIAQVGMVQRLEDEPAHDSNVRFRISLRPTDFASIQDALAAHEFLDRTYVQPALEQHLRSSNLVGWVSDEEVIDYIETDKMGVQLNSPDEEEPEPLRVLNTENNARTSLIYLENWKNQVRVVQGEFPEDVQVAEGVNFNVALSDEAANAFGIEAGDILVVDQRLGRDGRRNPGAWETSLPFVVQVTGIVAPLDPESAYWMAVRGENDTPLTIVAGSWAAEFRLFASKADVATVMQDFAPQTPMSFGWRLVFEHDELPYSRINEAREALRGFHQTLSRAFADRAIEIAAQLNTAEGKTISDLQFDYHTRLIDFSQTRQDSDRGILQDYDKKQEVNSVPFAVLLIEVGALVLFFLVVTAALVRRGERRELAMLQSRGAYDGHLIALRGIEALIICIFGAIAAPFLAQQLLVLLGPSIANTDEFPLPLTTSVFTFSALAAIVTFIALTATLFPVLRLPLIAAGGSAVRSDRMPWWERYYVDVILALIGLGGFILLVNRDTPLLETTGSQQKVDPLLVVAPTLLFLGLGGLSLRFFPYMATVVSVISARRRGLLNAMATWQLSRESLHYGRITFLLALAIGIGWFATSFRATVSRSQADQARYQVGTDIRLIEQDTDLNVVRVRDAEYYEAFAEVQAASVAYRTRVTQISRSSTAEFRVGELLAINPSDFGDVSLEDWRSDLGNIRVPYSPDYDPNLPVVGETLPFTPSKFGLWARIDLSGFSVQGNQNYTTSLNRLLQRVQLGVRLQDSTGAWIVVPFQRIRIEYLRGTDSDQVGFPMAAHISSGWVYYEANLAAQTYQPQGDLRLVSLFWEHRSNSVAGEIDIRLALAEMSLIDQMGTVTDYSILNSGNWSFVHDSGALATGEIRQGLATDNLHRDLLYVVFDQDALRTRAGINLNYPTPTPLKATVSQTLARVNSFTVENGEVTEPEQFPLINVGGTNVIIEPSNTTEYFPSLYNDERPYVIVDVRELMYWLNQRPSAQFYPSEVWIELQDDLTSKDHVDAVISKITDDAHVVPVRTASFAYVFDDLETDPLALGLLGLMFLAFLIGLMLSIVGLLTYAALTAQARRSEFGVLRALGLASSRVVWTLILEQVFVVLIAGILGSVLGHLLSIFVVPTLALGATGEGVVPPFITEVEWAAIGRFWVIMLVVLLTVFVSAFLLVRQLSLSRTLRLGDE